MSNGYLVAARIDFAKARMLAEGFNLDLVDLAVFDDVEAAVARLGNAPNVGLVLSKEAAADQPFQKLIDHVSRHLAHAQLIEVTPNAANSFNLPASWPAMSFDEAERRGNEVRLRRKNVARSEPAKPPPAPIQRTKIFISYRRDDCEQIAGRMYEHLIERHHFSSAQVFVDVDSLQFGVDFEDYTETYLRESKMVLALIGANWIGKRDDGGARINERNDWVRRELEIAFRDRIPVLPVLVGRARMPLASDLPETLKQLSRLNAAPLSPTTDFRLHMDRIVKAIGV